MAKGSRPGEAELEAGDTQTFRKTTVLFLRNSQSFCVRMSKSLLIVFLISINSFLKQSENEDLGSLWPFVRSLVLWKELGSSPFWSSPQEGSGLV